MRYSNSPDLDALRARIRAASKDAVVLEDMQRLGFWPKDLPPPDASDPQSEAARLIEREQALVGELQALGRDLKRLRDPVEAMREMRKQRMAQARERREEVKRKHAEARYQRALAWHARRQRDIVWLGDGVSTGLSDGRTDAQRVSSHGLPAIDDALALANAMGVPLAELRFLAYSRAVSRISHYQRFTLPKKSGGTRLISAPMPRLKRAQYWVLDNLLARQPVHAAAHGFVPGRSIVGNAGAHAGNSVVINFDLKDFFPSIAYPRVKGLFSSFGYSNSVSTLLALICTETPTDIVEIDKQRYHVAKGERCLPQGAPSSPAITNLLCRRLDRRLQASAAKLGFSYTRYADDMTFSAPESARGNLGRMLWCARQIIADEGFTLHPDKQRVMRAGSRQEVTGLVVNEDPAVPREKMRRFRATLYQVERDGPDGKHWNGNANVIAALDGYARFIFMVNPRKGAPLLARVAALKQRWPAGGATPVSAMNHAAFRKAAAAGKAPRENWWIPAEAPTPVREKTAQELADEKKRLRAEQAAATGTSTASQPDTAPRQTTADTPSSAPRPAYPPVVIWIVALHTIGFLFGALTSKNPFMMLAAIVWPFYASMKGTPSGKRFFITYLLCLIAWMIIRRI
jgi:RNA-directed DNA polymerase